MFDVNAGEWVHPSNFRTTNDDVMGHTGKWKHALEIIVNQ